ncbi:MAG: DUF4177 domain-containing protein, partial [Candidatus Dormibacteraceae bacterium]
VRWDYRIEKLKQSSWSDNYLLGDLENDGNDGWELVEIIPPPQAEERGFFGTTVGLMILKRPQEWK